jgi:tetratricopeptide (TPR) repeat protein
MLGVARVSVMAHGNLVELDPPADLDRAEQLLDEVLARAPNMAAAHYIFGQLQKIRGRYLTSIQSFERAMELNPSFIFAEAHIGNNLTRLGKPRDGLERIEHYMRVAPPSEPALGYGYLYAGEAQLALGQQQAALELMLRANAFFPGSPRVQGWLAAVYAIIGESPEAAKYAAAFPRSAPEAAGQILNAANQSRPIEEGPQPSAIVNGLRLALALPHS